MTAKLWIKFNSNNSTQVSTEGCQNVDDFLEACKKKLLFLYGQFPPGDLSLFTTVGSSSLRPDLSLTNLSSQPAYIENSYENPLFITVTDGTIGTTSQSSIKAPHPKRKERWEKLNEILQQNKKKKNDSTAYSYVSWEDVQKVLRTTPYVQSSKAIPDIQFNILSKYLSFATKCFGSLTAGRESQRLHLIAPILICVSFLFNGEVQIEVEEDLNGNFLKAHGHFEFVLCRGEKKVCIVEAKKDNLLQGMAQDLLGCEVAAEIGHLSSVYGIVTNYMAWNFFRSLDEKIEMEECSIELLPGGEPSRDSLIRITGKIYAMLSDE